MGRAAPAVLPGKSRSKMGPRPGGISSGDGRWRDKPAFGRFPLGGWPVGGWVRARAIFPPGMASGGIGPRSGDFPSGDGRPGDRPASGGFLCGDGRWGMGPRPAVVPRGMAGPDGPGCGEFSAGNRRPLAGAPRRYRAWGRAAGGRPCRGDGGCYCMNWVQIWLYSSWASPLRGFIISAPATSSAGTRTVSLARYSGDMKSTAAVLQLP